MEEKGEFEPLRLPSFLMYSTGWKYVLAVWWIYGALPIIVFMIFAQQTWWNQRIQHQRDLLDTVIRRDGALMNKQQEHDAIINGLNEFFEFDIRLFAENKAYRERYLKENKDRFVLTANPEVWGVNDWLEREEPPR